ncbi:MAG: hypothetical protein HWN80_08585 [Candidatus Lokiarchaeota archaeon]|nr:hypothetical protein [Candidatus Lokiarchaeota archaeon]
MTKKRFYLRKRECHDCTQNSHLLFITEWFGSVCRSCYKKELSYLVELLSDLITNCGIQVLYTEKDLNEYIKDVDSALEGIKIVWEQVYAHYRGKHTSEFQEIYNNLTKNEVAYTNDLNFF